jgi:hypothetical protein
MRDSYDRWSEGHYRLRCKRCGATDLARGTTSEGGASICDASGNPQRVSKAEFEKWADPTPPDREAYQRLLTTAKLLLQNAIGCATNHYGHDCELNGLPGWLTDCQRDIEKADAILAITSGGR